MMLTCAIHSRVFIVFAVAGEGGSVLTGQQGHLSPKAIHIIQHNLPSADVQGPFWVKSDHLGPNGCPKSNMGHIDEGADWRDIL